MLKSTNNHFLECSYLGRVDFDSAFEIQRNLWLTAKNKNQISIMGLEHPAVVTLGRRADESDVFLKDIPVVKTTRGGLTTVHSEGQLIIYSILNLKEQKMGVKNFVNHLLKVTQMTFQDFGIKTFMDDQAIGLYTENGKIAFCGLEIKEGISQHGLSINISNDLSLFDQIVSCGSMSLETDRLLNYRFDVSLHQFFQAWIENYRSYQVPT